MEGSIGVEKGSSLEWDPTHKELVVLSYSVIVSGAFSMCGSLFILMGLTFEFNERYRKKNDKGRREIRGDESPLMTQSVDVSATFTFKSLVFGMSFIHFLLSIDWIISAAMGLTQSQICFDHVCRYLAPIKIYLYFVCLLYICSIGTELVIRFNRLRFNQFDEVLIPVSSPIKHYYYHLFCNLFPSPLLLLIHFYFPHRNRWYCWWTPHFDNALSYALGSSSSVVWFYCMICYLYVWYHYSKKVVTQFNQSFGNNIQDKRKVRTLSFKMTRFLLVFLIFWGPAYLGFFVSLLPGKISDSNGVVFVMELALAAIRPLTGFGDALVYGYNRKLFKRFCY